MSFFALMPVRDEADIVEQSIRHALTWADGIFIFDTGSVDQTWDIVRDMARQDSRVHPVSRQHVYFSDCGVRACLFDLARGKMRDGDWFLRMDADEFHHVPPPRFVREFMRRCETVAWHQYYDFRILRSEVDRWFSGDAALEERRLPIELRRRSFIPSPYSEPRLCRYRSTMKWPETASFPYNAGFVARKRLPIRHYPHRDPVQMERRCRLRALMMSDAQNRKHWARPDLHHWSAKEWQQFITADCNPSLRTWTPGEELPQISFNSHLRSPAVRLTQRVVHALCLGFLDSTRTDFAGSDVLQPITPDVQRRLIEELGEILLQSGNA